MSKKIEASQFYALETKIEKKSTNFFVGYQPKILKILENGTKIGYRNPDIPSFLPQKTFNISEVKVQQTDGMEEFELITSDRVFEFRTASEKQRNQWLRAITAIKKQMKRKAPKRTSSKKKEKKQKKQKRESSTPKKQQNDSTLPSIGPTRPLTSQSKQYTDPISFMPLSPNRLTNNSIVSRVSIPFETWRNSHNQLKQKFHQHFKNLSPQYLQYHVFMGQLRTKSKEFFKKSLATHYYILFSSKSLYPDQHISQKNLSSAFLPNWADVDCLYRVMEQNLHTKLVFELGQLKETIQRQDYSLMVNASTPFEFFFDSSQEQNSFKLLLQIAHDNAIECKQMQGRKNYDSLILLHHNNLQGFEETIKQMIEPLVPKDHKYEPSVIKQLTDNLNPLLLQILNALEGKVNSNQTAVQKTIIDFVKIIHDEVKRYLKLVWDSSYSKVKGVDVLNMLQALSTYESLVNKYVVKDKQIYEAQKQLSKIYVRTLYRNFEKIIINVIDNEKKNSFYIADEDDEKFAQTYAVRDIFKFIYDFFGLAIPCWNNKLHLHNIHKIIKRSLGVFVGEMKSIVDEEEISVPQLIAISNNYVNFCEKVDEFYTDKFSELQERTVEFYEEIKDEFREVSMVIIDHIVAPLNIQLKIFFNQQTFFTSQIEKAYEVIVNSQVHKNIHLVHFVFKKRYYQRIFNTLREQILKMLQKQVETGKKPKDIKHKVIEKLTRYKIDLIQMADLLVKQKLKIQKDINQLITLLTTVRRQEIAFIISEASQVYRRSYKTILSLREDYKSLSTIFQSMALDSPLKKNHLRPNNNDDSDRKSFSKLYMQQFDRNSVEFSSAEKIETPSPYMDEKIKMISQGYVKRNKFNSGSYEPIYLKLKKSVLYIYQNQKLERCQNTIQIEDIKEIKISNADKPHFTICFQGLKKVKQFKIKCNSIEERMRWTYSIDCQLRRIKNDKKMKVIKMKDLTCNIIIDYDELQKGKDYFSYGQDRTE